MPKKAIKKNNEEQCSEEVEALLKKYNCKIVPSINLTQSPIGKFVNIELFKTFASLVEIKIQVQEIK